LAWRYSGNMRVRKGVLAQMAC